MAQFLPSDEPAAGGAQQPHSQCLGVVIDEGDSEGQFNAAVKGYVNKEKPTLDLI